MAHKIVPHKGKDTIVVQTKQKPLAKPGDWWNASSNDDLAQRLLATSSFLKTHDNYRYKQSSMYAQLYGNMPVFGGAGTNLYRMKTNNSMPSNRPTMSIITSLIDTICSRLALNRPRPVFLTDNGDYKMRGLAKQMNQFIAGEFYQTKYYELRQTINRDKCIFGTGVIKVLEDQNQRVALERRLCTQLLMDMNEAFLGKPRQLYELQLVDRGMLMDMYPKYAAMIKKAEAAYVDESNQSNETVADQIMVVEGWRLPSGPKTNDGMHAIACSAGLIDDESWEKPKFPFIFSHYSDPVVGPWGQGVAERQMGNQFAINQLLITIHRSINIMGVPRIWIEQGSKVVKSLITNDVGSINTFSGTKPIFETAQCNSPELYQELQNIINRAYQEEGVSQLAANSEKPAGLNSGEALREYDDVQQDRLSVLSKQDEEMATEVAYAIIDKAKDIALRDGKYETVYPNKDGTREIKLPDAKKLDDTFVIQCFEASSLPRDPSGRLQKVTEMMQAGIINPQEGRRLLGFPDIEQEDKLANAGEERILQILDEIVESGKYTPPDPFMDLQLAKQKVVQYYNLYVPAKLEEKKAQLLRNFSSQVDALTQQAMPPAPPMGQPQAVPQAPPTSDILPTMPQAGAA